MHKINACDHSHHFLQRNKGQNKLIYADIGPKSFEMLPHTTILDSQSHRVEYAQLNYCAQTNIQKMGPDSKKETNPSGMFQI